jgi:hypothetical protein
MHRCQDGALSASEGFHARGARLRKAPRSRSGLWCAAAPADGDGLGVTAYNVDIMQMTTKRNRPRRNAVLRFALLALAVFPATGCGRAIVGDWHMIKAIPNKEVFAIDDAHFAREGSFTATVTIEGKTVREQGAYSFNGFKLTMRPQGGGQRSYNTVLKGRTLEIHDDERKVFLRKGQKSALK